MQNSSVPYTYLIGWSSLKKYYYGVRYATGCNPSDLWVSYFTSSKVVKDYRALYGEPDVIQVRRTFNNKDAALLWEYTVLVRMNVLVSDMWLNMSTNGVNFTNNGSPRSQKCRSKISQKAKERYSDSSYNEKMYTIRLDISQRESVKSKISQKAKERFNDLDWKINVHDKSHQSDIYRKNASERAKALRLNPSHVANHLNAVNTLEYKELQRTISTDRWKDKDYREKVVGIHKERCSTPEYRQLMSDRAKASTEKRLATLRRNKLEKISRAVC